MTLLDYPEDTLVTLTVNNTMLPAVLNNTLTAQSLIKQLPLAFSLQRQEFAYKGKVGPLEVAPEQQQDGWNNGDIAYYQGHIYLIFSGSQISKQYKALIIIGHVSELHMEVIKSLSDEAAAIVELPLPVTQSAPVF